MAINLTDNGDGTHTLTLTYTGPNVLAIAQGLADAMQRKGAVIQVNAQTQVPIFTPDASGQPKPVDTLTLAEQGQNVERYVMAAARAEAAWNALQVAEDTARQAAETAALTDLEYSE